MPVLFGKNFPNERGKPANRFDICLVSPGLFGGGSERVCLRLANHWAQEGKQVELLLIRDGGAYRESLDPRVVVRSADKKRIRHALPWLVSQLWRQPHIPVLVFGSDLGLAIGLLKRARLVYAPIIYREWSLPEANLPVSSWWIYREAIYYLDGVVAQTNFAAASMRRMGVWRIPMQRIANPLDLPVGLVRDRALQDGGDRVPVNVLAVGRLSAEKRFDRLLRALACWHGNGMNFNLIIAGEGKLRTELEFLTQSLGIDGQVSFSGWLAEMEPLYGAADLFVLSSGHEGMPNALLEAIMSGCRVLSSGGGGVRELLNEIGLADCYLEESDFGPGFGARAKAVMAIPVSRWCHAQHKLAALTGIQAVGASYYRFCWQVADLERNGAELV